MLDNRYLIFAMSKHLGRVVRKAVNTNPGFKVNRSINFSCIKMFFTSYVLCSLTLRKLKTKGQTVQSENLTEKNTKLKSKILANPGLA